MMFITSVENAFKHGISPAKQSSIKVEVTITENQIVLVVENDIHRERAKTELEGFQLDAVDYLVKPVMLPRFLKAANKAVKQAALRIPAPVASAQAKIVTEPAAESGYLFVKVDSHFTRLQLTDIRYIEGNGDYVAIYLTDNRKLLSMQTLTQMMARLPGNDFYRVHRSYIVNLNHVDTVETCIY
jgi:two-component system LytT family response regulator